MLFRRSRKRGNARRANLTANLSLICCRSRAIALAISSAVNDKPLPLTFAAIGEISLAGEIRKAASTKQRAAEARRLGFDTVLDSEAIHLREALRLAFSDASASADTRVKVPNF